MRNRTPPTLPAPSLAEGLTIRLTRHQAEAAIEALIDYLDALDGDPDVEDDSEDCCSAADDVGSSSRLTPLHGHHGAGDPEDAEDDDPGEDEHDQEDDVAEIRRRYADARREACTRFVRTPAGSTGVFWKQRVFDPEAMRRRSAEWRAAS